MTKSFPTCPMRRSKRTRRRSSPNMPMRAALDRAAHRDQTPRRFTRPVISLIIRTRSEPAYGFWSSRLPQTGRCFLSE